MLFIELFAPKGTLSEEQRRHLSGRLVTEVMDAPDAPDALTGMIGREERYLERKFGEEYLSYKAQVRRWI